MTNQGATMAVAPNNGTLYVAWRQFLSGSRAITPFSCRSPPTAGLPSPRAALVANISPFDQGTSAAALSFRTNAFPTMAVDGNGKVYVAWSQRGVGTKRDARIVLSTSTDGVRWTVPVAVDNPVDRAPIAATRSCPR